MFAMREADREVVRFIGSTALNDRKLAESRPVRKIAHECSIGCGSSLYG